MYRNNYNQSANCTRQINLYNTFRKLWQEHIMWTRSFIISAAADMPDLQMVTQRLLRNPTDFATELRKYYGNANADRFEDLLREHLLIAADLVNAAKAENTQEANEQREIWYQNADDIAEFLAGINPNWSVTEWRNMLYDHLQITEGLAELRLTNEFERDIAQSDDIENQALMMADKMAEGILKQFNI